MTRECMDCKKVYGEKCPECGDASPTVLGSLCICTNPQCRAFFECGQGGRTTGLCLECFEVRRANGGNRVA